MDVNFFFFSTNYLKVTSNVWELYTLQQIWTSLVQIRKRMYYICIVPWKMTPSTFYEISQTPIVRVWVHFDGMKWEIGERKIQALWLMFDVERRYGNICVWYLVCSTRRYSPIDLRRSIKTFLLWLGALFSENRDIVRETRFRLYWRGKCCRKHLSANIKKSDLIYGRILTPVDLILRALILRYYRSRFCNSKYAFHPLQKSL